MKKRIFTLGECLYDIIFKNGTPVNACPGGSMLNTAVSLGRLKLPVSMLSEIGNDALGVVITRFLEENNVTANKIQQYKNAQTSLAIATLDDNNDANYSFYKNYPLKRLSGLSSLTFSKHDILLFGSSYSITKEIRQQIKSLLIKASTKSALIIYDLNIRPSIIKENRDYRTFIKENIAVSKIIKCSEEDIICAFGSISPENFYKNYLTHNHILICTNGNRPVHIICSTLNKKYPVAKIKVKSTIGAGDNFSAGIIDEIIKQKVTNTNIKSLTEKQWDKMINTAIYYAGIVCKSSENYLPADIKGC